MSNNKTYSILVIALLAINLGLLGFLILKPEKKPEHRPRHERPKNIIIERLNFDENQIATYEAYIKKHRRFIHSKDSEIISIKKELYQLLSTNADSTMAINKLTEQISMLQKEIEIAHFNHFKDIKTICKESQLSDYKYLIKDLTEIFQPPRKKNRRLRGK